jgi:hypothetical protein
MDVTWVPRHRDADDPAPTSYPGHDALLGLYEQPSGILREFGLRPWNDPAEPDDDDPPIFRNHTLWLLPLEWYDSLPPGLPLVDIFGGQMTFEPGTSDDGGRLGCLPYGITVRA